MVGWRSRTLAVLRCKAVEREQNQQQTALSDRKSKDRAITTTFKTLRHSQPQPPFWLRSLPPHSCATHVLACVRACAPLTSFHRAHAGLPHPLPDSRVAFLFDESRALRSRKRLRFLQLLCCCCCRCRSKMLRHRLELKERERAPARCCQHLHCKATL